MYEIPKPELLDPDRVNRDDREDFTAEDHRSQSQLLAKALGESCAYADQLWNQVNALRGYLLDCLPPDPRTPGPPTATAASPTGPDDEAGWTTWINAFATTTSVLCGSHGDSGFGLSRAREEARLRRTAPGLTLHAGHPELGADRSSSPTTPSATSEHSTDTDRQLNTGRGNAAATCLKAGAATVIGFLALRGLRAAPRTSPPYDDDNARI